jgi:hypothetical protein
MHGGEFDSSEFVALEASRDSILERNGQLHSDLRKTVAALRSIMNRIHVSHHKKQKGSWEECPRITCQEAQATINALVTPCP